MHFADLLEANSKYAELASHAKRHQVSKGVEAFTAATLPGRQPRGDEPLFVPVLKSTKADPSQGPNSICRKGLNLDGGIEPVQGPIVKQTCFLCGGMSPPATVGRFRYDDARSWEGACGSATGRSACSWPSPWRDRRCSRPTRRRPERSPWPRATSPPDS